MHKRARKAWAQKIASHELVYHSGHSNPPVLQANVLVFAHALDKKYAEQKESIRQFQFNGHVDVNVDKYVQVSEFAPWAGAQVVFEIFMTHCITHIFKLCQLDNIYRHSADCMTMVHEQCNLSSTVTG